MQILNGLFIFKTGKEVDRVGAWIKALRLPICILASFLAITGFKLARTSISWVGVVAVFFIASTTMLQNDWRDRFHDVRKSKVLAYEHQETFLTLLVAFWIICASLIVLAAIHDTRLGVLLAILAITGVVYSETRAIPLVPIAIVSLASASPVVLPLANGANLEKLWPLFLSTTFIIFAREIMKDLDDKKIDGGYKWTIPLALGERYSRILAAIAIVAGLVVATKVSPLILPAATLMIIAVAALVRGTKPCTNRKYLDMGMALVILTLIAFG